MKPTFDVQRIGEALSRPGIDPRTWTTLALVTAVNVTEGGVYFDVTTIMGIEEHAALSPQYAGSGFGFYTPISEGDFVLLAIPEGEFNTGARVIASVWDRGHAVPQTAVDHPEDVALVVKPGKTVRLVVSGGGNVVLQAEAGKVKLGDEGAIDPVALKSDLDAFVAGLDARIVVLTAGLPATATELATIQAVRNALPIGWPVAAQKVVAL